MKEITQKTPKHVSADNNKKEMKIKIKAIHIKSDANIYCKKYVRISRIALAAAWDNQQTVVGYSVPHPVAEPEGEIHCFGIKPNQLKERIISHEFISQEREAESWMSERNADGYWLTKLRVKADDMVPWSKLPKNVKRAITSHRNFVAKKKEERLAKGAK